VVEPRDCSTLKFTRTFPRLGAPLQVWRCSWGWKVRIGGRDARSVSLVAALEEVVGRLKEDDLRLIVATLEADVDAARSAERGAPAAA